jgi:pimeloyl-ACP methyl ester carboxylesterase
MVRQDHGMDAVQVSTPDGRTLEALAAPPGAEVALVYHGGTPTAAVPFALLQAVAEERGLRLVMYSRPGYATSDPRPGRTVGDAAGDIAAVLDAIGADRFVTVGWSGGGPHALACAALLADRCLAAATIGGVAPRWADTAAWMAGMGAENVEEFSAALSGPDGLTLWLEAAAQQLQNVQAPDVAVALGDLVSPVDVASLTGEFADWMAATFQRATSSGIAGWRDDDLAFVAPWGFPLEKITRPVTIWQGDQDRMVPFSHGQWLAKHVSGARAELRPGEGHLSLVLARFGEIIDGLLAPT